MMWAVHSNWFLFLYIKYVSMAFLSSVCIAMFDEWTGTPSQLKDKRKENTPTITNKKEDTPNQKREVGQATGWSYRIRFISYWVSCSCVLRRLNWCEYRPGVGASRPPPWAPHPRLDENLFCSSFLKADPVAGCVAIGPGPLSPDRGVEHDWSWPAVKEASGEGRVGQGCCYSCDPALDPDSQPPSPFGRDLWVLLDHLGVRNHKQMDNWCMTKIVHNVFDVSYAHQGLQLFEYCEIFLQIKMTVFLS